MTIYTYPSPLWRGRKEKQLTTPDDTIIRYDGHMLSVGVRPAVRVEAYRGRRWRWFGQKGWWVHLSLFHNWHSKKFVLTLAEAGVFLKYDPDYLPWIEEGLTLSAQHQSN